MNELGGMKAPRMMLYCCTVPPRVCLPLPSTVRCLRGGCRSKVPAARMHWVSTPECTPSECFEVAGNHLLSNSGEVMYDTSA